METLTSNDFLALANCLHKQMNSTVEMEGKIMLPITQVANIPCFVFVLMTPTNIDTYTGEAKDGVKIIVRIEAKREYRDEQRKLYTIVLYDTYVIIAENDCNNMDKISNILLELISRICRLNFDKFAGHFTLSEVGPSMCEFVHKMKNIKPMVDSCAVCFSSTLSKTGCRHTLCLPCMFNLAPSGPFKLPCCPTCNNPFSI